MLEAGKQFGHYIIRSKLGAGGMGEVYLAEDIMLERRVALKILPEDLAQDGERMRRFVRESKSTSALNHPNIITIYEIGESDATHFIAAEYVEGEALRERFKSGAANLKLALAIAVQIADALCAAHAAGIIHRDVKPENVMIRPDGLIKLLDFGIAKLTEQRNEVDAEAATVIKAETQPGMIIGTAAYMSPEQARGRAVDARTDVFSFGCLLYEMLSGRQPFMGENALDVIGAILNKEPAPLSQRIPRELRHIVEKCLRKDCEERYQTAKDLLIDLKDVKQELEFQNKLERTAPPNQTEEEARTQTPPATTADATHPTSSAAHAVQVIKKHKFVSLVVLASLLLVVGIGSYYLFFAKRAASFDSIAVLPFQNASGDKDTEFLSDGISETLINNFTKISTLRVIARSTAFRYRGRDDEPKTIGKDLGVGAILTGKVLQRGDSLSVQVDLINAQDGTEIWGNNYNGKAAEILDTQQRIARDVSERLRLKLSGAQEQQITKNYTTNPEAYQFYLRGRYYWNKRTAEGIRKAIEEFQQAINSDPNYGLGYVGLADCYMLLEEYAGIPASETLPKAKAAAERALQLDDSLAEAHASLGNIYEKQWYWAEAEREFKRAISLNPNYPTAHQWYGLHLKIKRQFDDAMRESKRAQELDPLSPVISGNIAFLYLLKNDIKSAIEECRKVIELDPSYPGAHNNLGWAYLKQRRNAEATTEFQRAVELSGRGGDYLSDLGYCYAVTGRRDEALVILRELEESYSKGQSIGQYLASIYVGLGHKDEAFALLEKDFEQHSGELPSIVIIDSFDDLRSDLRYADLMRRVGLQP